MASAAATKSRSTMGCAAPRVTRATLGMLVRPTASTISQPEGPSVEMATRVRRICGKARITSIALISTSSSSPREYAASRPTLIPRARPRSVDAVARTRIVRPPSRNRLQTSWPRWSVPNLAEPEGSWLGRPMKSAGPWGANSGPKTAVPATRITSASPIRVRPRPSAPRITPVGRRDWTSGGSCATSGLRTAISVSTPRSAGRLGREDARSFGGGTL